ncbi:MAG: glycosyltransferase family 39 protein [Hydrococcus sp. C42_A2020_068]|nr:glycosyltransferase family 39 protein [Hydrococcus sp. C42_A2020_068]
MKLADTIKDWWQSFEKSPKSAWVFSIIWLAFVCWLAFLRNLGRIGLIDETEPLFAEAARQMIVRNDWITPYFNEATRFDKPPLVYWLMAIGYKLIGVNEWAVRLPSALAAIAIAILCFFTLRYFGFATPAAAQTHQLRRTQRQLWLSAWLGVALVALNAHTIAWSRLGVSDMLLSGCMGTSLLCFFWGYAEEGKKTNALFFLPNRWYLGFYILSALAVLTKGPVGIVLPGLIIVTFLLYVGKLREVLQEIRLIGGGLIFLAVCLPWYILVTIKNGEAFLNSFFGYHNFDRFTSVVNNHSAPWYFYFLIVLALFAPWSIYLPLAITRLRFWQRSFWTQQPRRAHLSLFALFWFVDIFVFFTISVTKLPSYVLPLIPAAAILVALVWSEELSRDSQCNWAENSFLKINYGLLISASLNIFLLFLLAMVSLQIPSLVGSDAAMENLSELIQRSGVYLRGGIIWAIAGIVSLLFLRKRASWRWIIGANLVGFIAFTIFFISPGYALMDATRQLPLRQLSEAVTQVRQPGERLMMVGFKKPSVVFYTQQSVGFFWTCDRSATSFLQNLVNTSLDDSTVLIIGQPDDIEETGLQPQDYRVLEEKAPYQLIRVATRRALHYCLRDNNAN